MTTRLELLAVPGLPMVQAGDDLAALIADCLGQAGMALQDGDVLVLAQKIVSKAEGRFRPAAERDAAIAEESVRIVAENEAGTVRIVESRLGIVAAAAAERIALSSAASTYAAQVAVEVGHLPAGEAEWDAERELAAVAAVAILLSPALAVVVARTCLAHDGPQTGFASLSLEAGTGTEEDIATLLDTCDNIFGRSFCALGDGATSPIVSGVQYFRDEFVAHITQRGCPFDPVASTVFAGAHA